MHQFLPKHLLSSVSEYMVDYSIRICHLLDNLFFTGRSSTDSIAIDEDVLDVVQSLLEQASGAAFYILFDVVNGYYDTDFRHCRHICLKAGSNQSCSPFLVSNIKSFRGISK